MNPNAYKYLLVERLGDKPEWLRIREYREAYDKKRRRVMGEIMLELRGRPYWFPVTPSVYERFVDLAWTGDRGLALKYLQAYIRTYRNYNERWPDRRYVRSNKLSRNSFMKG